jgi:hypothetical protein
MFNNKNSIGILVAPKGVTIVLFAFIQQSLHLSPILEGDDNNLPIDFDAFNY